MSFVGYVTLEEETSFPVLIRDAALAPVNPDAAPTVRIYGPDGLVAAASTTAAQLDAGDVEGATNATPIVITSADHGLTTGAYVTVSGVGGNTGANGDFTVTRVDENTFSLDGSVGSGAYTSGGDWNVAGLYKYDVDAAAADGFEVGTYTALISYEVSGQPAAQVQTFIVV